MMCQVGSKPGCCRAWQAWTLSIRGFQEHDSQDQRSWILARCAQSDRQGRSALRRVFALQAAALQLTGAGLTRGSLRCTESASLLHAALQLHVAGLTRKLGQCSVTCIPSTTPVLVFAGGHPDAPGRRFDQRAGPLGEAAQPGQGCCSGHSRPAVEAHPPDRGEADLQAACRVWHMTQKMPYW